MVRNMYSGSKNRINHFNAAKFQQLNVKKVDTSCFKRNVKEFDKKVPKINGLNLNLSLHLTYFMLLETQVVK